MTVVMKVCKNMRPKEVRVYDFCNKSRSESEAVKQAARSEKDLTNLGGQYYYSTIHSRTTMTRLPLLRSPFEDEDVLALLKLVHEYKFFSARYLHNHWSGVSGKEGFLSHSGANRDVLSSLNLNTIDKGMADLY